MTQQRHPASKANRLRLAVFKFASCDGCQLSILNLEDELLALGQALDLAYFPEASSEMGKGPYDIALVEGSITTPEDLRRITWVREQARVLRLQLAVLLELARARHGLAQALVLELSGDASASFSSFRGQHPRGLSRDEVRDQRVATGNVG